MLRFIFGTIIGSFLCLVSQRLPQKISVARPASYCFDCQTRLKPLEMIPIVSILRQKFRCRHCGSKIPMETFLFELFCGGACCFFLTEYTFKNCWYLFFILSVLVLSVIDYHYLIVEMRWFILTSGVILLTAIPLNIQIYWAHPLVIVVCFLFLQIILPKSIGLGDLWVVGFWSLFLSGFELLLLLFIASLTGIIYAVYHKKRQKVLPFLPFLFIGLLFIFVRRYFFQF